MAGADEQARPAETILCDTSFVSAVHAGPGFADLWPQTIRQRLDRAVLAISVFTLAEIRDGYIYAKWGERRRQRAERLLAAYLLVPLDMPTVDRWAAASAACRARGVVVPDNDIWIASTACTRGWPLVSCDQHFELIPECDHILLAQPPR